MGEAKQKASRRALFLQEHPRCAYCGEPATTTDHCPARCFFEDRQWPKTFEFPACEACNHVAGRDEQALAVLTRGVSNQIRSATGQEQWERLVRGVRNNSADVLAEWMDMGASRQKRAFRQAFGSTGDFMRRQGWGAINIGPLTSNMIQRFLIKLGKSLFYKHVGSIFEGVIYLNHLNLVAHPNAQQYLDTLISIAPLSAVVRRNNVDLKEQFFYRLNYSIEQKILYAVIQFNDQFTYTVLAAGWAMAEMLSTMDDARLQAIGNLGCVECRLPPRP